MGPRLAITRTPSGVTDSAKQATSAPSSTENGDAASERAGTTPIRDTRSGWFEGLALLTPNSRPQKWRGWSGPPRRRRVARLVDKGTRVCALSRLPVTDFLFDRPHTEGPGVTIVVGETTTEVTVKAYTTLRVEGVTIEVNGRTARITEVEVYWQFEGGTWRIDFVQLTGPFLNKDGRESRQRLDKTTHPDRPYGTATPQAIVDAALANVPDWTPRLSVPPTRRGNSGAAHRLRQGCELARQQPLRRASPTSRPPPRFSCTPLPRCCLRTSPRR